MRFFVTSGDGTRIEAWSGGGEGPPVVISNGLGTPPEAWPDLVRDDCGLRVCSWYYRGTARSERPADPARVTVADHAEDLIAVMDAQGIARAVLACWSLGVNVGFEAALRHPERVAGILAVAGVPGGTFAAMGAPLRLPRALRHRAGVGASRAMRAAAPLLSLVSAALPATALTARAIAHTGFVLPPATPERLVPVLRQFREHDWRWYFTLALGAKDHAPMDLGFCTVPVTFVAGRHDVLAGAADLRAAAARIPHARLVELPGSHFLPLEHPAECTALLREVIARADPPLAAQRPRRG